MNQNTFLSIFLVLVLLTSAAACKKDPVETPAQPPQQQLPNPLPAHALVRQLKQTETDHQTMAFNALGQLTELRSQWQFVENDPTQIHTITYTFEYDSLNRPVVVFRSDGFVQRFFYLNNHIKKVEENFINSWPTREIIYLYQNDRIVQEIWKVYGQPHDPPTVFRHDLTYDNLGNLNKVVTYRQDDNQTYQWEETLTYSDFDNRLNPVSWMLREPYIPQLQLQYNNPGRIVRQQGAGPAETTTISYTYDARGLPASKRITYPNGGQATIQYMY